MEWKDVVTIGAPVAGLVFVSFYKKYIEGHEKEHIEDFYARRVHLMDPDMYHGFTIERCLKNSKPIYPQ